MKNPRDILITGASSGLGKALALRYAAKDVTLYLGGRNKKRLEDVVEACRKKGARAQGAIVDVTEREPMETWIQSCWRHGPLDLVIANAGISGGTADGEESDTQARAIFATNLDGMLNTIHPAIALMKQHGCGQVAIVSSLAGFRGMAGAPAYAASKGVERLYGEGLRGHLAPEGIEVSVICPGFIETPMTEVNHFPMPFLMSPTKAARIIARGLARNRARIIFPRRLYAALWLLNLLPFTLSEKITTRLPKKR